MRSVSRHTSGTKGSPTLQSSSSYINENRYESPLTMRGTTRSGISSTESGFGSDIFDVGASDFGRQSSANDRVSPCRRPLCPLRYPRASSQVFSDRTGNTDDETNDDPMLDNRGNLRVHFLPFRSISAHVTQAGIRTIVMHQCSVHHCHEKLCFVLQLHMPFLTK